jgi:Cu/Ag efflux pump CusA
MVWLELDAGLSDDQATAMFAKVADLLKQIPGVMDVKAGRNFTDRAPNITHATFVTLKDKQALAGYGPHPKHVEVQGILKPHVKQLLVVDIAS